MLQAFLRRTGARRAPHSSSRRAVPVVEFLEDRCVPAITISPTTLSAATVGAAYGPVTLSASGGTAPYRFNVGAGLPAGLRLSPMGVLSGTPTAGGSFNFTVTAKDSATTPATGTQQYSLTVNAPTIVIGPATLTAATVGASYSQTLTGSGGTSPYHNFAVSTGAPPAGLKLSAAGVLSGTPTAAGSFTFTVTAKDSSTGTGPFTGSQSVTLTVGGPTLHITPTTLPTPHVASPYHQAIHVSGGTAPYTFALASGSSLPKGLTLTSTGVITGTPTAQGASTFTVQATDHSTGTGAPFPQTQEFTLTVAQGLPSSVAIVGLLPGVDVNSPLPSFQVVVQDALHNRLKGVTVTLRLVTLGAPLPAGFGAGSVIQAVTGADGVARFSDVTVSARGVFEIEAVAAGAVGSSNAFTVALDGRHSPK
jgi:hypothetical protein